MPPRVTDAGATRITEGADIRVTEDFTGGLERVSGREPLQLVEVHQDFCSLRYGEGLCAAILPRQPYVFDFLTGLPAGASFARATAEVGWGEAGLLVSAAIDTPLFVSAWNGSAWVPDGLSVGPALTTQEWSRDLTQWGTGTSASAARNATGADGGANKATTVTDSSTVQGQLRGHQLAIPADTATCSQRFLVKKQSAPHPVAHLLFGIAGVSTGRILLDPVSGDAVVDPASIGVWDWTLTDRGDWLEVWIRVTNNGGGTSVLARVYPAYRADLLDTALDVTQTGSQVIDFAETRFDDMPAGGAYIEAGAAAASVGASTLTLGSEILPDGVYDIVIGRAGGDETLRGVAVSGGWTVPASVSPLRTVTATPRFDRADATGTRKCYNTRATCQDPENYDPEDLAIMFARPTARLPKGWLAIPAVESVTTAPTRLNINGANRNAGALGNRAVATVTFRDHPYPDRLVDKYRTERGFDPLERGTFWTKWLARNPYYQNRRLVIRDGYVGQALEEMVRRDYLIDRIAGPDAGGTVTLTAKDALKLADDERAQAPAISPGELTADLDALTVAFAVSPAEEEDYPASGTLRIGREVMTYASRTADTGRVTFAGIVRGTDGTTAASHDAGERAQLCLRYTAAPVQDVVRELLVDYGNVPAAFIDDDAWAEEGERWLQGFELTTLLTEPAGVDALVGEIQSQVPVYVWWDERARQVRLRADRRDEGTPPTLDERDHIVAGSAAPRDDPAQRITQVWVFWRQRDPTSSATEDSNYARIRVRADLDAESAAQYGESRIRKVYARWLDNEAQATLLAARLLVRYGPTPRFLSLTLDAKDRELWTADFAYAVTRLITDDTGEPLTDLYQVIQAEETMPGHAVAYELQRSVFDAAARAAVYMAAEAPNYLDATDEQRASGCWFAGEDGKMSDGSAGYVYQ